MKEIITWSFITLIALSANSVLYLCLYIEDDQPAKLKVEYELEILNDDSVKILSVGSDRVYTVHIDSIQVTLLEDNL